MEANIKERLKKQIQDYELKRLREANLKFKLEIIELKEKLREIHSVASTKTKTNV
jgi:hypothetical protein